MNKVHGQNESRLFLIDSLKKNVLNSKITDSSVIATAHYNIGELYRYSALGDSSYYHYYQAEKIFRKQNAPFQLAKTLYGIAAILTTEKYYTGAEVTSFEAIRLLENEQVSNDVNRYKSFVYNNLGIVFMELEEFEQAINYNKKALKLKEELEGANKETIDNSKNNLANTYKNYGQYELAIELFYELFSDSMIKKNRPDFYALIMDNYAHTLYLSKNYKELPQLFLKALKICDSLNSVSSIYTSIGINQNLAEYYYNRNKNDSASYYAQRAKQVSEQYANDDLLRSLLLLSKIEVDSIAVNYYEDYIKLNDSLQKSERAIRNKFARIRFETNQIEQENIQIAKERLWLLIISVVVIIASLLLYMVINQRNKNRELQFIQKQQETNEEIYNLMLSQNETIEEARTLEKKRISQELHDGVLGRLFGTRLSLDSLNMNNSNEAIKTRSQYIDGLKTIEEDIRKVSHELNTDFVSGSGFIDIIKTLVETQTLAYKLKYELKHDDAIPWDEVTNKNKIHVYRIIQEALHNIYKHANASQVKVSFKMEKNIICLILTDDGSGFDVNKAKSGIGLKNMNSRINEINGTIEITSEKEVGTTVTIEFPIT